MHSQRSDPTCGKNLVCQPWCCETRQRTIVETPTMQSLLALVGYRVVHLVWAWTRLSCLAYGTVRAKRKTMRWAVPLAAAGLVLVACYPLLGWRRRMLTRADAADRLLVAWVEHQ